MHPHHLALIYTMVLMSAADREMSDAELASLGEIVRTWPVFRDFDRNHLTEAAQDCAGLLQAEEGLETTVQRIDQDLPHRLRETAYALACEIAAADGSAGPEEMRLLEILRDRLEIPRLSAAAIEHATRVRHLTA